MSCRLVETVLITLFLWVTFLMYLSLRAPTMLTRPNVNSELKRICFKSEVSHGARGRELAANKSNLLTTFSYFFFTFSCGWTKCADLCLDNLVGRSHRHSGRVRSRGSGNYIHCTYNRGETGNNKRLVRHPARDNSHSNWLRKPTVCEYETWS